MCGCNNSADAFVRANRENRSVDISIAEKSHCTRRSIYKRCDALLCSIYNRGAFQVV